VTGVSGYFPMANDQSGFSFIAAMLIWPRPRPRGLPEQAGRAVGGGSGTEPRPRAGRPGARPPHPTPRWGAVAASPSRGTLGGGTPGMARGINGSNSLQLNSAAMGFSFLSR
jgi:hypothetical protein